MLLVEDLQGSPSKSIDSLLDSFIWPASRLERGRAITNLGWSWGVPKNPSESDIAFAFAFAFCEETLARNVLTHVYREQRSKSRDSSVDRASAWSHTVSGGMIAPGFESHQCLTGMWKRQLGCHTGHQEVGRCHGRGEPQGMCNITHMPLLSSNKAEPTLALKPRGDVTRSPKQEYQWPHKKDSCPPKILKKKKKDKRKYFAF